MYESRFLLLRCLLTASFLFEWKNTSQILIYFISPSIIRSYALAYCSRMFIFHVPKNTKTFQLRVTAARPGNVNFELDIKKEHTVYPLPP